MRLIANFISRTFRIKNIPLHFLEVIIKIEKSQNLHLFQSNLILRHLHKVNIAKFISIAVHKEIVLFIHKGS